LLQHKVTSICVWYTGTLIKCANAHDVVPDRMRSWTNLRPFSSTRGSEPFETLYHIRRFLSSRGPQGDKWRQFIETAWHFVKNATKLDLLLQTGCHELFIISGSTVLERTLAASHRRFHNLIETFGRTPWDEWSARRKGLYLLRASQHRKTRTNIHALSGIRIHYPSNQAAKTCALVREASRTGLTSSHIFRSQTTKK
jgi:hypothetical protein